MRSDGWFVRIWKLFYPLFIYFIMSYVLMFLAGGIWMWKLRSANPMLSDGQLMELYQQQILSYQMLIVLIADLLISLVLFVFYCRDSKRLLPVHKKTTVLHWILIVLLGMFGCLSGNFIVTLSGLTQLFQDISEELAQIQYSGAIWVQFVSMGIAAPIMEEILFRGLIFRRMRTYCKYPVALILSALIFGLCHGNILQFLYAFLLGLLMGMLYEKFRTLWAPIVFHAAANSFSVFITNYVFLDLLLIQYPILTIMGSFGIVAVIVALFHTALEPKTE